MTFTPQKYSKMYGNIKIIVKHSVKTLEQAALYELLPGFCLFQGLPFVKSFLHFTHMFQITGQFRMSRFC